MQDAACSRCGRPFFGSALARTAKAAKHPLMLCEERSRGPVEPDHVTLAWRWCIDCAPLALATLREAGMLLYRVNK